MSAEPSSPDPAAPSTTTAAADAATAAPLAVTLQVPSKYKVASASSSSPPAFAPPPHAWFYRAWTVTHSTLSLWRSAQNVRISYAPLPPGPTGIPRNQDRVEYESNKGGEGGGPKKVKTVEGVNTGADDFVVEEDNNGHCSASATSTASWNWRGKGWLFFVTSHWEILGWGERPVDTAGTSASASSVERWAVTWFAPTLFTAEGIDFYCDRRDGMSAETLAALQTAISQTWPPALQALARELKPVDIR